MMVVAVGWEGGIFEGQHRDEFRLRCQVGLFVGTRVAGNVSRESFRVFDNTRDISVDFPCHFVQEVCHLEGRVSTLMPMFN